MDDPHFSGCWIWFRIDDVTVRRVEGRATTARKASSYSVKLVVSSRLSGCTGGHSPPLQFMDGASFAMRLFHQGCRAVRAVVACPSNNRKAMRLRFYRNLRSRPRLTICVPRRSPTLEDLPVLLSMSTRSRSEGDVALLHIEASSRNCC